MVDVIAPLLEPALVFSNDPFAKKYSVLKRGVLPAMAVLGTVVLEKALAMEREERVGVCRRHAEHTVVRPLYLRALLAGYRIIIACRCELAGKLEFQSSWC